MSVCMSMMSVGLSVHGQISKTKFSCHVACGRGSVLAVGRCSTLCTSGFMDAHRPTQLSKSSARRASTQ